MKTRNLRNLIVVLTVMSLCTTARSALARTLDVCANAATDARFDSTNTFFVASAPIYPGGTIAQSATAIDCTKITATSVGTFFTIGGLVAGLPASSAQDVGMVTWHFRVGNTALDTVGPVQNSGTPGFSYPQTIIGNTGPGPSRGVATVTNLDPSGFVFEIKTRGGDGM
jgi:hypothetical protein